LGNPVHTIVQGAGSIGFSDPSQITTVALKQLPYVAGAAAGDAVTLEVAGLALPEAGYEVVIGDLGQDATAFVSARTAAGFTLNIHPRLAANALAAGAVDLLIVH
jgi:hypothetical protein